MSKENNKLIAEFMRVDQINVDTWLDENEELNYNSSWNWLMPVVEKIESLDIVCFEKNLQEEGDYQALFTKGEDIFICHYADTSIEATYKAVVEFIKQHK